MLKLTAVEHRYRKHQVLGGVSLSLQPGVTGLVGVNGAGKTTLMRIAAGALKPAAGRVAVGEDDLYRSGRQAALRQVSWMPQTTPVPPGLTARRFVEYLTWLRGNSPDASRDAADRALRDVELGSVTDRPMRSLSGGMQRRAWLAQALAGRAPVLLLDEPSTGLDPRQRAIMVRLLGQLSDDGTSVLMSSHILEDVNAVAERIIVLDEGRVCFDGPTSGQCTEDWFLSLIGAAR